MKYFLVKSVIFFFCILLGVAGGLSGYCFRFTWMGSSYNNETIGSMNGTTTCRDVYDACTDPMVYTHNGLRPDFHKLWEKYQASPALIACSPSPGEVCAKWTSYFDDEVEYTMHTCTKITIEGEGSMTSGCVTSVMNNSRTTEVCACRTNPNERPCNSGQHPYTSVTVCCLIFVFFFVVKCVT